jgi:hypothetical protein
VRDKNQNRKYDMVLINKGSFAKNLILMGETFGRRR